MTSEQIPPKPKPSPVRKIPEGFSFKWIGDFIQKLRRPKRKPKFVSVKEVKEIYKGFSKNQLIRVIIKLIQENALLKHKKGMIRSPKK